MSGGKRGRESVGDMVRSLGLVLAIVVVAFVLAQPPDSDERGVRVVDATEDIAGFASAHAGVPVPGRVPDGWRTTVSEGQADLLRVGWVTPAGRYAEYASSTAAQEDFVREVTAEAPALDPVDIDGLRWQRFGAGTATSLIRSTGGATVVLGTRRGNASLDELRLLARSLTGERRV